MGPHGSNVSQPSYVYTIIHSDGQLKATFITLSSLPEEVRCVEATLNGLHNLVLTESAKDVSSSCVPGRNELILINQLPFMLTVVVQIELKRAIPIDQVLLKIPRDIDSVLDLSRISISKFDGNVETLQISPSNSCPITLKEIVTPVKGDLCKHSQPFDARSYLLFASQTGVWKCPICRYHQSLLSFYNFSTTILPEDLRLANT